MFEGIDGVGKTTQIDLLREALQDADWPVLVTRNMGGTPMGEALRKVIKSSLERPPLTDFYISLAVQEPLLDVIDEARAEGKIVLMDRGPLSLAAYQIYGGGVDEATGWRHVEEGMDRIKPDIVIFYDTDVKTALARIKGGAKDDYFESKPPAYFEKVAEGFRTAAGRFPAVRVIDGSDSVADIQKQTMSAVIPLLK